MAIPKVDKAGEPSMDEILASIRKIISEEPAGAKKSNGSSLEARLDAMRPAGEAGSGPRAGKKETVDDILGLADAEPTPAVIDAAPAATEKSRAGTGKVPSWLFPASPEPSLADRGPSLKAPVQNGIKPFFGAPLPDPAQSAEAKVDGGREQKPIDLGAIIPQRVNDANGSASRAKPQVDSKPAQKLPEWRVRGAQREIQSQASPQVLAPPEEPTLFVQPDAPFAKPALSELSTARVLPSSPAEPVVTSTVLPPLEPLPASEPSGGAAEVPVNVEAALASPSVGVPEATVPQRAEPMPESAKAEFGNAAPPAAEPAADMKVEAPVAQSLPAQSVGTAPSEAATEPVAATMPVAVASVETASPARDMALPVVGAAPVAKPTVIVDRGPRTKVTGSDLVAAPVQGGAVKTLEDTVVDLLRPMIRQWLDENMPRMVEKALRVELAESVRAKLEQQKH